MISFKINNSPFFDLKHTVLSHGWINLAPFSWDGINNRLNLSIKLGGGYLTGSLAYNKRQQTIVFSSHRKIEKDNQTTIEKIIGRTLSLDQDIAGFRCLCIKFDRRDFLRLSNAGWGRILRCSTAWEDAVKTICTTNASWAYTKQMCQNLCEILGKGKGFPSPEVIADAGVKYLKEKIVLGYRSEYVHRLARRIIKGELKLEKYEKNGQSADEAVRAVESIDGFGPYAANHFLVLLGWHQFLPIDREVMKFLKIKKPKNGKCPIITNHYKKWGDYRFIAYKMDRILSRRNWIGD